MRRWNVENGNVEYTLADPGRKSRWWIGFRKGRRTVIPAKLALTSASRNTKNWISAFAGKTKEAFSDERSSHSEKSPGREAGEIYEMRKPSRLLISAR